MLNTRFRNLNVCNTCNYLETSFIQFFFKSWIFNSAWPANFPFKGAQNISTSFTFLRHYCSILVCHTPLRCSLSVFCSFVSFSMSEEKFAMRYGLQSESYNLSSFSYFSPIRGIKLEICSAVSSLVTMLP